MAKQQSPSTITQKPSRWPFIGAAIIAALAALTTFVFTTSSPDGCPQTSPMAPPHGDLSAFRTPEFRNWSLAVLQRSVRVRTEAYDDAGPVGLDHRWDVFYEFERVLKESFPNVHHTLLLEHVNTHSLVYTWNGTVPGLKPTILMAHQDVVPVFDDSLDKWTHPPYAADFDGTYVWGRGASDDKGSLLAILEAVEILVKQGMRPRRTIILAFGFDEEISGHYSAAKIGKFLETRYGPNSVHSIIDEGGLGVIKQQGVKFALPGVIEKGMFDIKVQLNTPGGHSSMPPDHTAIGIISELAVVMESTPFQPVLTQHSPVYAYLRCTAEYAPVPAAFRGIIQWLAKHTTSSWLVQKAIFHVLGKTSATKYMVQTSQAIDLMQGGLKVNALPEQATLVANYRIDLDSTVQQTLDKVIANAKTVATKHGLGVAVNHTLDDGTVNFQQVMKPSGNGKGKRPGLGQVAGSLVVSNFGISRPVSPITPTVGSEAWETLSGTIRYVFEEFGGAIMDPTKENQYDKAVAEQGPVIVAPSLMVANTDTVHYWRLSDNIFRFAPYRYESVTANNIHTVDERIALDVHIEAAAFYYSYILNV
ncbi:uncharacterized protein SAPINGB_P005271 [Magnusiomyces paraingens]|uniref:Peptidase M20 dimerisation domain-containing protein n=1 Tax=Magnusiomyces paraingens TaxID=2606893 RepID=A0A5E8BZB1_9ASCO|nr:uncharacterized protein SAPINGB_P005271 [Saprochaete ingens]VVT56784.1 unnamed protein product [Saprochaete ingens]